MHVIATTCPTSLTLKSIHTSAREHYSLPYPLHINFLNNAVFLKLSVLCFSSKLRYLTFSCSEELKWLSILNVVCSEERKSNHIMTVLSRFRS